MAYLEPDEYAFFIEAFQNVGAPVFARVAVLVNARRRTKCNSKNIANQTLQKAWEVGWPRQHKMPPIKSLFPDYEATGVIANPVWPAPPKVDVSIVSNQIETSERSEQTEVKPPEKVAGIASEPAAGTEEPAPDATHNDALVQIASKALEDAALDKLAVGRIHALANEVNNLVLTRKNLVGVQGLLDSIIGKLQLKAQVILTRLTDDMETGANTNVRAWMNTMGDVVDMLKSLALTFKVTQESQRLLVGMPQRISEERRAGDDDREGEGLGKMAKLLRTRSAGARAYGGEEKPVAVDVSFTEPAAESASDPTNGVAKESDAAPISAELQPIATG